MQSDTNDDLNTGLDYDLDPVYDSPLEASLRKQVVKLTLLARKRGKQVKTLQQQTRRLFKKNLTLKSIIKDLRKHRFIDTNTVVENKKVKIEKQARN